MKSVIRTKPPKAHHTQCRRPTALFTDCSINQNALSQRREAYTSYAEDRPQISHAKTQRKAKKLGNLAALRELWVRNIC